MAVDSFRTKIFLLCGGTIFGALFGLALYKTVHWLRPALPSGAQFNSVDDLRRAMLARDDRDVHADQSVSFRSIIQPDPSDLIIYRLRPNLDVKFEGVPVRTNSFGMRSPEVSVEKPAGTYRVALLGDSFAFGWGVEQDQSFARIMEDTLNKKLAGKKQVQVLDFGVPGYSTFQEAALFEDLGLQFKPDAVLVYFIENDFGLPFFIKNFANNGQLVNNQHFQSLKAESENTAAEEGHTALANNLDAVQALRKLAKLCDKNHIQLFLTVNPNRNYRVTSRKLYRARRIPNMNIFSIRNEVVAEIEARNLPSDQLRLPKDPHPSALKHDILGRALAEKMLPFVEK